MSFVSYAPLAATRPDTSRYIELPQLALCSHCGTPVAPLQLLAVSGDNKHHTGLCGDCAFRMST